MTTTTRLLLLLLGGLIGSPAAADSLYKRLYGKGALVVRDRSTQQPLSGAAVTFAAPNWPLSFVKPKAVAPGHGVTDVRGYAEARVVAGEAFGFGPGVAQEIVAGKIPTTVEKAGYKTFRGELPVFFTAYRGEYRPQLFLDEVHLAPADRPEPSAAACQSFQPQLELQPQWGDFGGSYVVRVSTHMPAVLAHEFRAPLLKIGVMGSSAEPRKPEFVLQDDGKAPDSQRGDGVYSGYVTFPAGEGPVVVEQLPVLVSAREQLHALIPREGHWYSWKHTTRTLFSKRTLDVLATVLKLPVQAVIAGEVSEAEQVFQHHFSPSSRLNPAVLPFDPYQELAGRLENPPPSGWRVGVTAETTSFGYGR